MAPPSAKSLFISAGLFVAAGAGLAVFVFKPVGEHVPTRPTTPAPALTHALSTQKSEDTAEPSTKISAHAGASTITDIFALTADNAQGQLRAIEALLAIGPEAFSMIENAWRDAPTATAKSVFAGVLARLGTKESVAALLAHAREEQNPEMRAAILSGLDALVSTEGVCVVADAYLEDLDPAANPVFVALFERAPSEDFVRYLGERYTTASASAAPRIREMLASIREPTTTPVLESVAMATDDASLREAAFFSLAKIATPQAVASLMAVLQDPHHPASPETRERLLAIMANVKNPQAAAIVRSIYSGERMPDDIASALAEISADATPVKK